MTIVGASTSICARPSFRARRRVEFLSGSSRLADRSSQGGDAQEPNHRREQEHVRCHFETPGEPAAVAGYWTATFVTQILGQGLPPSRPRADAGGRAYARAVNNAVAPMLLRVA
jgi:hypothetical protein